MAQPERRTLDPKLDVVFKILFASPEAKGSLISLLTAVLRPRQVPPRPRNVRIS